MSELLDEKSLMKERRGLTLKVLCILSWVFIGLYTLQTIPAIFSGPLSPEEMEDAKVVIIQLATPEIQEIFGAEYAKDSISYLEKENEYFYSILGLNLSTCILGFYAVFMMFNLKKGGYYLYVIYSLVPVVSLMLFFEPSLVRTFGIIFWIFIALLFCVLYAFQLKRMS